MPVRIIQFQPGGANMVPSQINQLGPTTLTVTNGGPLDIIITQNGNNPLPPILNIVQGVPRILNIGIGSFTFRNSSNNAGDLHLQYP